MIYLDYAATSPVPEEVAKIVYETLCEGYGNPSSQYALGRSAKEQVEKDRKVIAGALGCDSTQLFFTSCGTEGDNWAIQAALWQNRHVGKHIITTAVEHSAVLEPLKLLAQQGYEITYLAPSKDGTITCAQVEKALRPDTALISMMLVNNETGNIYPVAEVSALLKAKKSPALLHCDAVQGFLEVPFTFRSLGADFVTISGHKIGAPKGIGAMATSSRVKNLRPLLPGGGQENGLRSGTEATAQIAGFAKAVSIRLDHLGEKLAHIEECKQYAKSLLAQIPGVVFVGTAQAPQVLAFSLSGYPSQNIINDLSTQGICLSAGSACHQGKPSHVFSALHLEKKVAMGTIRMSFSPLTTKEEIQQAVNAINTHRTTRFPML